MSHENNALLFVNVHIKVFWTIYYLLGKFSLIAIYCHKVAYGVFLMDYKIVSSFLIKWLFERTFGDQRW